MFLADVRLLSQINVFMGFAIKMNYLLVAWGSIFSLA